MSTVYSSEGRQIPVTVVEVGPCTVAQIKTASTDGYNSLQLAFGARKEKRMTSPVKGHLKKSGLTATAALREVPVDNPDEFNLGQVITTDIFHVGEMVDVTGKTKGRGFSGVMRRHGFAGGKKTHGSHSHRIPGSIGCSAWPAKVTRGKRMPGAYGNDRQTVRNLEIVDIRPEENLVLLKGAIPGSKSGLVIVRKTKFAK
jgi:large subunit ribosomal protein L3